MAWYWNLLVGVGAFNLLFVLLGWLVSVVKERSESSVSLNSGEASLTQECILHFLQTMCLAERQKN